MSDEPDALDKRLAELDTVRDAQLAQCLGDSPEAVEQQNVIILLNEVRRAVTVWQHTTETTNPQRLCDACFTVAQELIITGLMAASKRDARVRGTIYQEGFLQLSKRLIQLGIVPVVPPAMHIDRRTKH